jgi:hypothetical protein
VRLGHGRDVDALRGELAATSRVHLTEAPDGDGHLTLAAHQESRLTSTTSSEADPLGKGDDRGPAPHRLVTTMPNGSAQRIGMSRAAARA